MLEDFIKIEKDKAMLTELIEENKITLLHGESGTGKTVFILKHLNVNNIEPFLVDFDDNTQNEMEQLNIKTTILDGEKFMEMLLSDENGVTLRERYRGAVLIIDTWTLFITTMFSKDEDKAFKKINKLASKGFTIILTAHSKEYSGKEAIPDVKAEVYKHIKARLYIRKTTLKKFIEFHLLIEKLRGHKGSKIRLLRTEHIEK